MSKDKKGIVEAIIKKIAPSAEKREELKKESEDKFFEEFVELVSEKKNYIWDLSRKIRHIDSEDLLLRLEQWVKSDECERDHWEKNEMTVAILQNSKVPQKLIDKYAFEQDWTGTEARKNPKAPKFAKLLLKQYDITSTSSISDTSVTSSGI